MKDSKPLPSAKKLVALRNDYIERLKDTNNIKCQLLSCIATANNWNIKIKT